MFPKNFTRVIITPAKFGFDSSKQIWATIPELRNLKKFTYATRITVAEFEIPISQQF